MKRIKYICLLSCLLSGTSASLNAVDYIHISEIMYDSPLNEVITAPPYSNGEYIELYNAGNETANLAGWKLRGDGSTETLTLGSISLPSRSSLIVAFRHGWTPAFQLSEVFPTASSYSGTILYQNTITLKNTKEYIRLYDADGLLRDSLYYGNETSIKPISDRLIAENEDNTPGNACLSVQRKNVVFGANGVAAASHLHWTVAVARPFQTALAYTQPDIPAPDPGYGLPAGQNYIVTRTHIKSGAEYLDQIQYFDGLGRPVQTMQKGISPQGSDLATYTEYDGAGREWKNHLPVTSTGNGAFVPLENFTGSSLYSSDSRAFAEILYEPSPLNRVEAQKGAGAAWNNHPVTMGYDTNGDDVKYFYVNASEQLVQGSNYPAASLYKTTTADEDGKATTEYKDKLGQIILTRQAGNHDTYYVYNDLGQLSYVLPPLAADANGSADALNKYGYSYQYDERSNCTYKKLPGCEPIYMVYDKAGRLVLSQDGNQRPKNEWTFNKYDELGRLIISGIYHTEQDRSALAQQCKNIVVAETYTGSYYGYSWDKLPEIPYTGTLMVNYYDDYSRIEQDNGISAELRYKSKDGYGTRYISGDLGNKSAKGLLVGTRTMLLDGSGETAAAYYYDYRGRVVQTRATNHLGGYDITYHDVDFTGNPNKTLKEHNILDKSTVYELYTYVYDHAGRLEQTKYKINNRDEIILAAHTYDELGRLTEKKRHNNEDTESFAYNIRNQLTRINSGAYLQQLYYNTLPAITSGSPGTPCYNGNISYATSGTTTSIPMRCYKYTYDELNRLKRGDAYYYVPYSVSTFEGHLEDFTYDKMGNITRLIRSKSGSTPIDLLYFNYNGNQVQSIYDSSGSQNQYNVKEYQDFADEQTEFLYDANGNMITDLDRNIVTIKYNLLNLPDTIQFKNGNQIVNSYDAAGNKLRSKTCTVLMPEYIPLINTLGPGKIIPLGQYDTDIVYDEGTDYFGNIEYPISNCDPEPYTRYRINNSEGYCLNGEYTPTTYYYYRRDHLGNNREVWNAINNTTVQRTQYYPSGLPWAESSGQGAQPYKYNGKEFVETHGLDMYDYGARGMYPAIMRFTTMDPLAEKYYSISPYAYVKNNPIRYIDPDGRKVTVTGTKEYRDKVKKDIAQLQKDNSEVGKMIKELLKSPNVHNIEMPDGEGYNYIKYDKEKQKKGTPQGSTIGYDPDKKETASGDERTPRVGLAHELQHSSDIDKGKLDNETKTETGVSISEVNAVNTENKIRKETGDEKRTTYGNKRISKIWLDD